MASLIVNAHRDDPDLTQETIKYLNTSTNQRRLTAQVTGRITLNQLAHCQTTSEIVAMTDRLNWLPSPTPTWLGTFIPYLFGVSQGVRVALAASS